MLLLQGVHKRSSLSCSKSKYYNLKYGHLVGLKGELWRPSVLDIYISLFNRIQSCWYSVIIVQQAPFFLLSLHHWILIVITLSRHVIMINIILSVLEMMPRLLWRNNMMVHKSRILLWYYGFMGLLFKFSQEYSCIFQPLNTSVETRSKEK